MSSSSTVFVLIAVYLVIGAVTAGALRGRGQGPQVVASAVVAWPLLLGLFEDATTAALVPGPLQPRILRAFLDLHEAVREAAVPELVDTSELAGLRASLLAVDSRLGMVDRLLDDEALRGDPLGDRLRDARARAAGEIEGVLRGMVQLKLQVGLLALAGDTLPVRERMRELGARVRALEEISLT